MRFQALGYRRIQFIFVVDRFTYGQFPVSRVIGLQFDLVLVDELQFLELVRKIEVPLDIVDNVFILEIAVAILQNV